MTIVSHTNYRVKLLAIDTPPLKKGLQLVIATTQPYLKRLNAERFSIPIPSLFYKFLQKKVSTNSTALINFFKLKQIPCTSTYSHF